MKLNTALFFGIAFALSWIGVALFRRWSLGRNLLDVPNERSSHVTPTPRGGGLIIALVGLLGYVSAAVLFDVPFSWGFFAGALLIATVSWLDDLYSLPFWTRLIVHIAGAVILVADLGVWRDVSLPVLSTNVPLGTITGTLITVGWVVWLVNAYNFMDGIDGIAALQATIAGIGWAVLGAAFDLPGLLLVGGLIASASLGFLIHNWQPAKIFMGDVGSAFLGFTLAALPLLAASERREQTSTLPVIAVLFVWYFVFDTVFTLVRRSFGKKRVWEAHREHLYQAMIIGGWSHAAVTLLYGSAAAILTGFLCFGLIIGGNYLVLAIFSLFSFTSLIIYLGGGQKD